MRNLYGVILSLVLGLVACGKGTEVPPGLGGIPGSMWKGDFQPLISPGVYGQTQKINMNFGEDQNFITSAAPDLTAQGEYRDYTENQQLTFEVVDSNYDLFGKPNDLRTYNYQMGERELKLEGDGGRYLLMREQATKEAQPFDGDWSCNPSDGSRWNFNFSQLDYRASKAIGNNMPIYIEGSLRYTEVQPESAIAFLEIKTASREEYKGMTLRTTMKGAGKMDVEQLDKELKPNPNTKPISCHR
jgi:hypothetical protein